MAAADGVGCIVDAAIGPGSDRELENLKQMATRSEVHVVAGRRLFQSPISQTRSPRCREGEIADHLIGTRPRNGGELSARSGRRWKCIRTSGNFCARSVRRTCEPAPIFTTRSTKGAPRVRSRSSTSSNPRA